MPAKATRGAYDLLELELWLIARCHWVLGFEPGYLIRLVSAVCTEPFLQPRSCYFYKKVPSYKLGPVSSIQTLLRAVHSVTQSPCLWPHQLYVLSQIIPHHNKDQNPSNELLGNSPYPCHSSHCYHSNHSSESVEGIIIRIIYYYNPVI